MKIKIDVTHRQNEYIRVQKKQKKTAIKPDKKTNMKIPYL